MFRIEISYSEEKVHHHDYWMLMGLPTLIFEVEGRDEDEAIENLIDELGFEDSRRVEFYAEPLSNSYDLITED